MTENFASWIGPPARVDMANLPFNFPRFEYSADFVAKFNSNPIDTIKELWSDKKNKNPNLKNVKNLSSYLYMCERLSPMALTKFFLSETKDKYSYFFFFFTTPALDYMPIHEAIYILISRIALPMEKEDVIFIIEAFADAYLTYNSYGTIKKSEIMTLTLSAIIFSMSLRKNNSLTEEEFSKLTEKIHFPKDYITNFFNNNKAKPTPIFFTFLHFPNEPNTKKEGMLSEVGIILKKKEKEKMKKKKKKMKYCSILHSELQIFNDSNRKELYAGIPLKEISAQLIPSQGKEDSQIIVKSHDDKPFGYSIKNSQKKTSKSKQYIYVATSDAEAKEWVDLFNFISFYNSLCSIISDYCLLF